MKKAIFAFFAFQLAMAAPGALAADRALDRACVRGETFKSQIYNCGRNIVAVQMAAKCSDALMARAAANGANLHSAMDKLKANIASNQTGNMKDAVSRLKNSIKVLETQILQFQEKTSVVADYVKVMIDFPDAELDVNSAECFSENFHPLQEIVSILDAEIVNSKRAREEALRLLQRTSANAGDMRNLSGVRLPASSARSAPGAPKGPKGKNWNASDISGTKPEKKTK